MTYDYIYTDDIILTVEYDYEEGQTMSYDTPPFAPSVDIRIIHVAGDKHKTDIMDLLADWCISDIEHNIFEYHE